MNWDRLAILRALFPTKAAARDVSQRWRAIATKQPELANDLIRLGNVLTMQVVEGGELAPVDPIRLAYEAGRRDLALQLLAMMKLTNDEQNQLTESDDA